MYFLNHLKHSVARHVEVEYRLLCSGELYPANIMGDWRKSDGARLLLREPFQLIVASQPYDDYPQELALRFTTQFVEEASKSSDGKLGTIQHFLPDREIAADFAAILSLLCRRLITVSCKVRERYSDATTPPPLWDWPIPLVTTTKQVYWKPRPADLVYHPDGITYKDNQPAPRPFDAAGLSETLRLLRSLPTAEAIVRCARRYALGMELIDTRWEIAYQHLISAAETIAGDALAGWTPDDAAKVASKSELVKAAMKEGLPAEAANRLAIEASADNPWSRRKFKKFLLDHTDDSVFADDDLFLVPEFIRPKKDDFEKHLNDVYDLRSGASHSGKSFPPSASIGPSAMIPTAATHEVLLGKRPFPPIGWFERVVNNAICNYIKGEVSDNAESLTAPANTADSGEKSL